MTRRQNVGTRLAHIFNPLWRTSEGWAVLLTVGVLVLVWVIVVKAFPPQVDTYVTHYSIPFGIDGIGQWWLIWIVPAIASCLFLLNIFIFLPFARKHAKQSVLVLHILTTLSSFGVMWGVFLLQYQQR